MSDVSLGLAHEAAITLRNCGADQEFWMRIAQNQTLAKKVVDLVRPRYRIVVDYNLSLAEMIRAGDHCRPNVDITAEHFPVRGTGSHKFSVVLLHFTVEMRSDEVPAEMGRLGYRPAKIEHLLALSKTDPDVQRRYPITALDSVWNVLDGRRSVASLGGNANARYLSLFWVGNLCSANDRFLGVPK